MMSKQKYIAEGFEEDAQKLLNDFIAAESVEFPKFAEIFKDHHFSLIFMGRPDETETSEFTNEVYRISMHFLTSTSFYQRVGAVYLLYALYRNQIADPPIKIRIVSSDWLLVKQLHEEANLKQFRTLHYVIDYLIKNAFLVVAKHTLKGPTTGTLPDFSDNSSLELSALKSTCMSDLLAYSQENKLKELIDLKKKYLDLKKGLEGQVEGLSLKDDHEVYNSFISEMDELLDPSKRHESVGERRARLKRDSYLKKNSDRLGQEIEVDEPHPDDSPEKTKSKRRRRRRRSERRVGRPSKKPQIKSAECEKSDEDNIDISHLVAQQNDLYLPPDEEDKKNVKPSRYYCRESPRREPDNDCDEPES